MKIDLKAFQQVAVDALVRRVRQAQADAGNDDQAVVLSAPTGAGKTIMATALIERLLEGDEEADAMPELTVLWLTDQPELNEQTRRKMRASSSLLSAAQLVTIEPNYDAETFAPGAVYFLNTQKLARNSTHVRHGDGRNWTLWETIANTIAVRSRMFLLLIDEAHRGMAETERDRERAQSIVQKFIKGSLDEMPPFPVVVGISATPGRFVTLLAGVSRTVRPAVDVPPEEVRASGLLKETLLVYHPDEQQPADMSLLRAAAASLLDYERAWSSFRESGGGAEGVLPVLVVQVQDRPPGKSDRVSATDLEQALSEIEGVLGPLGDENIAHAFQEGTPELIGTRVLRYVAPPDIQEDARLRVVFFKTSLNTGWDCPRAEVIMSFRAAADHTLIAQLVGRMVRTPLARRIEQDEFLNTVSLYLPHYNREGLQKVLSRLQEADPDFLPPVRVQSGEQRSRLSRNSKLADCFRMLEEAPSYDVTRIRKTTDVRRLIKFARLLARDEISPSAPALSRDLLVGTLNTAREALEGSAWWSDVVKDAGEIDLRKVEWTIGTETVGERRVTIPVTQQNIDDLFATAGRQLGEGLHKAYWKARCEEDPSRATIRRLAKLEAFALTQHAETREKLEAAAHERIAALQKAHRKAVRALPADRKEGYDQVRLTAKEPEPRLISLPEHIEGTKTGHPWPKHIYVDSDGNFSADFTKSSWEVAVLQYEMEREDFLGWLRNPDRKDWALCIPYRMGGEERPFYPDFIVFRSGADGITLDILDPHDPGRDDWVPKVRGLADYASKHWQLFGRIEAIYIEGGQIKRLDLCVEKARDQARAADGPQHLKSLFS